MTGSLAGLVAANVLFIVVGAELLPLLRIARTRAQMRARLALSYIVGLAAVGVLAAHLALVHVPVGFVELVVLVVVLAWPAWRRWRALPSGPRVPVRFGIVGTICFVAALTLLGHAARAFEVRPLVEWDGWAIWGMKARALYDFGGVQHTVFTSAPYGPLQHPLWLPAVESVGFRAMGAYDGTLIHLQLALLAIGFAAALWALLAERVPAALAGVTVLAIVAADSVLRQLAGNLADIPLAFLVALGAVALAAWVRDGDATLLPLAALFLGAATLTKPEGMLFAAAAIVAALVAGGGARLRGTLFSALAVALILLPWRIYVAANGLKNPEYDLGDALRPSYLADRSDRFRPALAGVWHQVWSSGWGLLVPFALVALAAALLAGRARVAAFAVVWGVLSFFGIVLIFWISVVPVELTLKWAAYRTVASLVLGAAALAPLLAGEAWLSAGDEAQAAFAARLRRLRASRPSPRTQ